MRSNDRAVIILAGGFSKRMGKNKSFVQLAGKPLIHHIALAAQKVTDKVLVVIRKEYDGNEYANALPASVVILRDALPGQTPLIGILTGAKHLGKGYAAVVACDTPFVDPQVLERLFEIAEGHDAAVPKWQDGGIEPLQAVYRVENVIPAAEEALRLGELRNDDMIKRFRDVVYVPVDDFRAIDSELLTLFNVNTPDELERANQIISARKA